MITATCLLTGFFSTAQNARFGFSAGAVFANYNAKYDQVEISGKSKTGITAGMLVDFPMGKKISFQPALNFVQKGTKNDEDFGNGSFEKSSSSVNSLEMPLNFLFNASGNSGTFFVGGGPSFRSKSTRLNSSHVVTSRMPSSA